MLARYGRVLRERARLYLPSASDDEIEGAVERTVDRLLEVERPSFPHGLRYATQVLYDECRRGEPQIMPDEAPVMPEGVPVDQFYGPLIGRKARALEYLSARARSTLVRRGLGWSYAEIAKADNTTVPVVRVRVHHARKRLGQLLGEKGPAVSALLIDLPTGLRTARNRALTWWHERALPLTWPGGDTLAQMAAVVTVAAVVSAGATSGAIVFNGAQGAGGVGPTRPHLFATRPPVEVSPAQATTSARDGSSVEAGRAVVTPTAPSSSSSSSTLPVLGDHSPGNETPESTQLITAAAPAGYTSTHTIVALGVGHSCACTVLFQSTDGGANWTPSTAQAPPGAEQLALPPDYPGGDSRIFIGTDAHTGTSPFVVSHFGDVATPLPAPPGHIGLSALFDRGDDRLFIAGEDAVESLTIDSTPPELVPLLMYPQWAAPARVATSTNAEGGAAIVLAPPGTLATGNPGAGETSSMSIFICDAGVGCTWHGAAPSQAQHLTNSPSAAVSVVSWALGIGVSQDVGQTFVTPGMPPSATSIQSVAATDGQIWAMMQQHGAGVAVFRAPASGGPWTDVTMADADLSRSGSLVAIPGGPLLDLLAGGGLRCTADGGLTWGSRCP